MEEVLNRFENAVLSFDRLTARSILTASGSSAPVIQVLEELVVPALEHIGKGWENGTVALSQVYMSGRICEELVDEFLPPGAEERKNHPAMAIAVLDDYHLLGKRIVLSVLRAGGFELLDYGHGIKADELAGRVKNDGVKILLISTLMLPSALRVGKVREILNSTMPNTKIIVGGAPFLFDRQLWKEVGADAMGRNASDALNILSALTKEY